MVFGLDTSFFQLISNNSRMCGWYKWMQWGLCTRVIKGAVLTQILVPSPAELVEQCGEVGLSAFSSADLCLLFILAATDGAIQHGEINSPVSVGQAPLTRGQFQRDRGYGQVQRPEQLMMDSVWPVIGACCNHNICPEIWLLAPPGRYLITADVQYWRRSIPTRNMGQVIGVK